MVGEYTLLAVAAVVAVVALELSVLRTGLLRQVRYWIAVAIVLGFQVPVDGWLTRPGATVVHYSADAFSGIRVAGHFPVEDFGFGYALVTLTLLLWYRLRRGRPSTVGQSAADRTTAAPATAPPARSAAPAVPGAPGRPAGDRPDGHA